MRHALILLALIGADQLERPVHGMANFGRSSSTRRKS